MPQIVEAKALAWFNLDTRLDGCRPEMMGNEHGRGDGNEASSLQRRKYKIRILGEGRFVRAIPLSDRRGHGEAERAPRICGSW